MTNGHKTSERKACYTAFYAGLGLALSGIACGADMSGLAGIIIAVCTPLMWYAGNRSYVKTRTKDQ